MDFALSKLNISFLPPKPVHVARLLYHVLLYMWCSAETAKINLMVFLFMLYCVVEPKFGMVLRCFGLKTVIDFVHFGLESGIVFEGATVVYEHFCRFVPNE